MTHPLAAFLDFSAESDPFSLRSPLPRERVLERLAQCLNPDTMRGFFFHSYPGTGPLIGIIEGNRFRLFLRPSGWFSGFAGDFQGEVVEDGPASRVQGNFREPQFAIAAYLQKGPRTIRGSSTGFVFFLIFLVGSMIFWIVRGFDIEAASPAAIGLALSPFVVAGHWFCIISCRKGRRKILTELAMIAESNDTPWTKSRPRKAR